MHESNLLVYETQKIKFGFKCLRLHKYSTGICLASSASCSQSDYSTNQLSESNAGFSVRWIKRPYECDFHQLKLLCVCLLHFAN